VSAAREVEGTAEWAQQVRDGEPGGCSDGGKVKGEVKGELVALRPAGRRAIGAGVVC